MSGRDTSPNDRNGTNVPRDGARQSPDTAGPRGSVAGSGRRVVCRPYSGRHVNYPNRDIFRQLEEGRPD